MKRSILLIIAILGLNLMLSAQADLIPVDPNVRMGELPNGLKYYIQHNAKPESKVELRLAVNAGSMQEDEDQQGLAHFLEHMNFNGTKNFDSNELVSYLQSIGVKFGAHLNAYTSFDETVYMLNVPTDGEGKIDTGLLVLEDWAQGALLTEEEIDKERGVVYEEYRIGLGPDERMRTEYFPKLLYQSRYAERLPIGKGEIIQNCEYDAIRRFYRDWYRPNLMAVAIVGDIDVDVMEKKVIQQFSKLENPANPRERIDYPIPNHKETFISVQSDPEASYTMLQIVYKDPEPATPTVTVADFKDDLRESLFSTMINNRLNELANSKNPPFMFAGSGYSNFLSNTKNAYSGFSITRPDKIEDALRAILEENKRVSEFGFTEAEFDRAKKALMAALEKQYEGRNDMENRIVVSRYVSHFLNKSPIPSIEWRLETAKAAFDEIKLAEVERLIHQYIREDNRVVVITGPEQEGLVYPSEADIAQLIKDVDESDIQAYSEDDVPESIMSETPNAGTIVSTEYDKENDIHTVILSNGVRVDYKKTDFKEDEVLFSAVSYGGTNLLSVADFRKLDYGLSDIDVAGFNGYDKSMMDKILSGKIARVKSYVSTSREGVSGNARPSDLETLFQLIHVRFTALNKDKEAYIANAEKTGAFYDNMLNDPESYFSKTTYEYVEKYNDRHTNFPSTEKLKALDYDFAYDFYNQQFSDADDFRFYFVGNFDEAKLLEYIKTYIASLPSREGSDELTVHKFKLRTPGKKLVVNKGSDPKSQVRISYNDYVDYDSRDALLLNALGEVLTIKLIEELREEQGGVYGVRASGGISKMNSQYNFNIGFPCGPEKVDSLVGFALAEVQKIRENGPGQADVDKVIKAKLLDLKENLKKNRYWLDKMEDAYYYDRDLTKSLYQEDAIKSITAEELQRVAVKYLDEYRLLSILMPEE